MLLSGWLSRGQMLTVVDAFRIKRGSAAATGAVAEEVASSSSKWEDVTLPQGELDTTGPGGGGEKVGIEEDTGGGLCSMLN